MKVKVIIYQEKIQGGPLEVLSDAVYGEVSSLQQITPLLTTALNNAYIYLQNTEIITMIESSEIKRWLDIVNIQNYLRKQGLFLLVSEVVSDEQKPEKGTYIEVVTPNLGMLPMSTVYYDESSQYDIVDIITEQVQKFNLGDNTLVPNSDIVSTLSAINDMKSKGMPIFPMYVDTLQNELANYGFTMYYVYV